MMRLGGPVFVEKDPELWGRAVQQAGYRATGCPVASSDAPTLKQAFRQVAAEKDILIAEVGAWSNPISPVQEIREKAVAYCKDQLNLAEEMGARCCVNIAGSRGEQWDGPHPDNLSDETFELTVDTVREIIDAVQPRNAFFALESMPWVWPDSPDAYLKLIQAIDRKQFAVHLDPVNMINSPRKYYENAAFIRECFAKLGPYLKSCHAKDILLSGKLTVHLAETRPGTGALDYRTFLRELNKMPADTPVLLEHLDTEQAYQQAAQFVRETAGELGISL